ncbi:hypothetical protein M3Y96_00300700 [Aphelenchoides besseyi]|nr:hypothetical protein M3Y96_00300700 [Aphelenchoides besseyi]
MFGWRCLIVLLLFLFEGVLCIVQLYNPPFMGRNRFTTMKTSQCTWKFNGTEPINGYFQFSKEPVTIFFGFTYSDSTREKPNFLRIGDCFVEFSSSRDEYDNSPVLRTKGIDERAQDGFEVCMRNDYIYLDILEMYDQTMINKFTLWPGQQSDEFCPDQRYYSYASDGNLWTRIVFAIDSSIENFEAMVVSIAPISEYPSNDYSSTAAPTTASTTVPPTTNPSTLSTSTSESNMTVEWTQSNDESSWTNETTEIPTTLFPLCEDMENSFSMSISPMIMIFILNIIHFLLRV